MVILISRKFLEKVTIKVDTAISPRTARSIPQVVVVRLRDLIESGSLRVYCGNRWDGVITLSFILGPTSLMIEG